MILSLTILVKLKLVTNICTYAQDGRMDTASQHMPRYHSMVKILQKKFNKSLTQFLVVKELSMYLILFQVL